VAILVFKNRAVLNIGLLASRTMSYSFKGWANSHQRNNPTFYMPYIGQRLSLLLTLFLIRWQWTTFSLSFTLIYFTYPSYM
jgi:hypothetical protein